MRAEVVEDGIRQHILVLQVECVSGLTTNLISASPLDRNGLSDTSSDDPTDSSKCMVSIYQEFWGNTVVKKFEWDIARYELMLPATLSTVTLNFSHELAYPNGTRRRWYAQEDECMLHGMINHGADYLKSRWVCLLYKETSITRRPTTGETQQQRQPLLTVSSLWCMWTNSSRIKKETQATLWPFMMPTPHCRPIRFTRNKWDTINVLKETMAEMEAVSKICRIKEIRMDNGGEYICNDVAGWFCNRNVHAYYTPMYS